MPGTQKKTIAFLWCAHVSNDHCLNVSSREQNVYSFEIKGLAWLSKVTPGRFFLL